MLLCTGSGTGLRHLRPGGRCLGRGWRGQPGPAPGKHRTRAWPVPGVCGQRPGSLGETDPTWCILGDPMALSYLQVLHGCSRCLAKTSFFEVFFFLVNTGTHLKTQTVQKCLGCSQSPSYPAALQSSDCYPILVIS